MEIIILSKVNRKKQRPLDKERYKARHLVENIFQRIVKKGKYSVTP